MTIKASNNGKKATSTVQFDPDDLNAALRDLFDLFEKLSGTKCLLLGKTAESVRQGFLNVPKIQAGIRELDLTRERKGTIYSHLADYLRRGTTKAMVFEPELEHLIAYDFKGVPIEIKIIQRQYSFFKNLDPIMYNFDYYALPNPLDKYLKAQYIVK